MSEQRSQRAVFGIVGDTGNPSGDEGSLHLLQELGYPFHDGRSGSVTRREIIVRFFPSLEPEAYPSSLLRGPSMKPPRSSASAASSLILTGQSG